MRVDIAAVQGRSRAAGDPTLHEPQAGDRRPRSTGRASPRLTPMGASIPSFSACSKRHSGHREGEVSAEAGGQAEPEARARHVAHRGRHRRGVSGAGGKRKGGGNRRSPSARWILGRTSRAMASGRSRSTSGSGCRTSSSPRSPTGRARAWSTSRISTTRRSTSSNCRPRSTLDKNKRAPIVHEMQRIQYERGGYLIWSFQNTVDAYSKKLGGIQPVDKTALGPQPLPAAQAVLRLIGQSRDADVRHLRRDRPGGLRSGLRPTSGARARPDATVALGAAARIVLEPFRAPRRLAFSCSSRPRRCREIRRSRSSATAPFRSSSRHCATSSGSIGRCSSQYAHWLGNLLRGSLGNSLTSPQSVGSLLLDRGLALAGARAPARRMIAIPLALLLGSLGGRPP